MKVQNYSNNVYGVPQEVIWFASKHDEIIFVLKEALTRIHKLEQQPSSSGKKSIYFGKVNYHNGKAKEEPCPLNQIMSSFERIGLEDLQDLAESFANMSMVDLKMTPGDGALKPRDQQQPPPYYQQQQQQEPQFQP